MFRPSMSAGLNGWGEGGTFDCQEEGVDGQAPAGPACHGMATWIKCWRMSWTPFSCGGRKYELETPWLWYFRAKLVSPYFDFSSWRGSHWCWNVFVKIHSDPFGPQHINCLRCLAPSWHISAVAPAGSEGCCPVPGALLHRGALDFSPFRVTTSSCNGGWSERFRCLWSARITFGISFYFLPFVSAQVNSGKMDIKKKSQVTVFWLFRRFLRLRVDIIWCLGRALQALREAQLPQEDRSNYPRWAGQGRFVVKCSLELIDASTLNTSIFFGWGKYDLLRWVHRFSNLRLNPGTGGPKHFSSCLLVLFRPYFDRWFSLYPLSFVSLEIMTALCLSCQKVSQGVSFLQA